jgi:hypothetical protein
MKPPVAMGGQISYQPPMFQNNPYSQPYIQQPYFQPQQQMYYDMSQGGIYDRKI